MLTLNVPKVCSEMFPTPPISVMSVDNCVALEPSDLTAAFLIMKSLQPLSKKIVYGTSLMQIVWSR